jgi:hypothetical protein
MPFAHFISAVRFLGIDTLGFSAPYNTIYPSSASFVRNFENAGMDLNTRLHGTLFPASFQVCYRENEIRKETDIVLLPLLVVSE